MTEDEAKGKWCPMYRVTSYVNADGETHDTDNRKYAFPRESSCLASACMMWRVDPRAETHGHCGLAGKEESRHV